MFIVKKDKNERPSYQGLIKLLTPENLKAGM